MIRKTTLIATVAAVAGLALGGLGGVAVGHHPATHDAAEPVTGSDHSQCKDIGRPADPQNLLGDHWPTASGCALMALSDTLQPEQAQWVVDAASHIESARGGMSSLVYYAGLSPEELGSDKPMSPNEARVAIQHEAEHLDTKLHGDAMRLFGFNGLGLPDKPDYILVPIDQARDHLG